MSAPQAIFDLVERFEQNKADYRAGKYNETQVRREFLDPFFKALGWDVDNEQGYAEAYKDVVHEATVKVGEATKAPDYAFRIGGTRKFFVEAKKPSVNIRDDISPAFQTRRYAWSAKLPLSILTDFEEFAVYDCRVKPHKNDKASTARVMYFSYDEYLEKWDEIAAIFSRDAVLKGSFDKYAASKKKQRGTAEVDDAFLEEIERWRDLLARNIALRNKNALSPRELNEAVQLTIDRIIFLRIAEGRGVEVYGQLREIADAGDIYAGLTALYQKADARYNSGLFHFGQGGDELTLRLTIDNKPLKDILTHLYYPESPYVFSEIPADILGQVYERFLGKVIRLTPSGQAKVEEKPEVRKAGGVYYTPTYIVDYIVEQTVGALLEGKTPKSAEKLKIIDPACGSGTFLLGAFEHLIQWHLNWYVQDDPSKWAKKGVLLEGREGWQLTLDEKKKILTNHLYGVDIDAQAVEVTKLSLLLKVIETPGQLGMLTERILPDLSANVKCGNSLIGSDYYHDKQMPLMGDEEFWRVNAFDWQRSFAAVFASGGFDAVIGNPPYIRMEEFKDLKTYLKAHYESHDERSDMYAYFIEKEHRLLNKKGRFGMIVSNKFLRANYGKPLRKYLRDNVFIERVADFAGLPIFKGATVRTIVLITSLEKASSETLMYSPPPTPERFNKLEAGVESVNDVVNEFAYEVSYKTLEEEVWSFTNSETVRLLRKLEKNSVTLNEYCDGNIGYGIKSGLEKAFVISKDEREKIIAENPEAASVIKPYITGRDIRRFQIDFADKYLIYTYHDIEFSKYAGVEKHLKPFKAQLQNRATQQNWYELQQPQFNYSAFFEKPKIVLPDIAAEPRFALDNKGYYGASTIFFIPLYDLYLLGLLNSKLGFLYFRTVCARLEGKTDIYFRFKRQYLQNFPIRTINFADPAEVKLHDEMVALVERMLSLHEQEPKSAREKEMHQRQIEMTDAAIDRLVYRLYGLTEEEIGIVES